MNGSFHRVARETANMVGRPTGFIVALVVVAAWAVTGPIFHFSDTWQLVINTGTTIVTFLMVFLIQNTQNRDAKAVHLKLDELVRATRRARNTFLDLDDLTDAELEALEAEFRERCLRARAKRDARADLDPGGERASGGEPSCGGEPASNLGPPARAKARERAARDSWRAGARRRH